MAKQTLSSIKNWFRTGLKPTQAQFWDTWDSFWHKDDAIPVSSVEGLSSLMAGKTDNEVFNNHLNDNNAHYDLFANKQNINEKGVAHGYVPLDEFVKVASQYLSIVDDLVTGGSAAMASAETVKTLKSQIDAINLVLTSDDVNLDTVQELVDAIKEVETSLETILVNDLTTGGITKALTAEMGKSLKTLIDALESNKVDKVAGERLINASEIIKLSNQSNVNTGDETESSIVSKLGNKLVFNRPRLQVNVPSGFNFNPPFAIYKDNTQSFTTNLNPETFKQTTSTTYYFSTTGSDGNNGLTEFTPKKSLNVLISSLNASPPAGGVTFIVAPGEYPLADNIGGLSINFNFNLICPNGKAYFRNLTSGITWVKVSGRTNIYSFTDGTGTSTRILDKKFKDESGLEYGLKRVADADVCDATPGTYYTTGTLVAVHLLDARVPDADVIIVAPQSTRIWHQTTPVNCYVENIIFMGSGALNEANVHLNYSTTGVGNRVYFFKSCEFSYSNNQSNGIRTNLPGAARVYALDCVARFNQYDGFNWHASSTAQNPVIIEISCVGNWNGQSLTNGNDNGSTVHSAVRIIRINGVYCFNRDRNVHDVGTSRSWNLGCVAGESQATVLGNYTSVNWVFGLEAGTPPDQAGYAWLDNCVSNGGSFSDIETYDGCTVGMRNCFGFLYDGNWGATRFDY